MKKLIVAMVFGAIAVSACSSDKAPVAPVSNLVIVHHVAASDVTSHVKKHHKKNASGMNSKLGS